MEFIKQLYETKKFYFSVLKNSMEVLEQRALGFDEILEGAKALLEKDEEITSSHKNTSADMLIDKYNEKGFCDDYIFFTSKGRVIYNLACVFSAFEDTKDLSAQDLEDFLAYFYPKQYRANPIAWRRYSLSLYNKIQATKGYINELHNPKN